VKLFLAGADPKELRASAGQGIIEGVVAEVGATSGGGPSSVTRELCDLVKGPVLVRVAGEARDELLRDGRELSRLAPNLVVSLSFSATGLEVVRALTAEGIKTSVTDCLNPEQALLAAKAGAAYLSPSLERGGEVGHEGAQKNAMDGGDLVRKISALYRTYGHATQVLYGAVRNPSHIVDAALAGAHAVVVPYAVLQQLGKQPPADLALGKLMASK
jgi:transaldolase